MEMRVLVIDDAEINVMLLCKLLDKLNHCIPISFSEPEQALAWCQREVPDLVFVDYMMPVMNGIDFISQFRKIPACLDIPILMITANDETAVRYDALEAGANDFLTKPIDKIEFLARSKNMLALRKNQRLLENRAAWLDTEVKKATAEIKSREKETILRLSRAADSRDPETGAHILRMANYSRLIGENLGLSEDQQQMLLDAAPMHDIGKVGIPDHILLKPGKLTPEEFAIMKTHAMLGYQILAGSQSEIVQNGAEIALAHHEKFDGSGYPQGLRGQAIPLYARIVAVADVFDALTSERPYKSAWPLDKAVQFLKEGAGQHFDPACVAAFLSKWEKIVEIRERYKDDEESVKGLGLF